MLQNGSSDLLVMPLNVCDADQWESVVQVGDNALDLSRISTSVSPVTHSHALILPQECVSAWGVSTWS